MAFFDKIPLLNTLPKALQLPALLLMLGLPCCFCLAIGLMLTAALNSNRVTSAAPSAVEMTSAPTSSGLAAWTALPAMLPASTGTASAVPAPTQIPSLTPHPTVFTVIAVIPTQQPVPTAVQPRLADARFACAVNGEPQYGTVVDVVDGDTIKVLMNGLVYPLRYIGMNTPENTTQHEYFGPEASAANSWLTAGKQVTLYRDLSEVDRYDRLLRYVFVGDTFVNNELIRKGFAEAAQYPPDTACASLFNQTAQQAQASGIGIWVKPTAALSSGNSVVITAVDKRAEYVDIQNTSGAAVNLTGWNLISERGHQGCVLSGMLAAGQTLRIWSMSGNGGFSCHYPGAIWNNTQADQAVLYNSQGLEVDRK